jgi:hypothetical protein
MKKSFPSTKIQFVDTKDTHSINKSVEFIKMSAFFNAFNILLFLWLEDFFIDNCVH